MQQWKHANIYICIYGVKERVNRTLTGSANWFYDENRQTSDTTKTVYT